MTITFKDWDGLLCPVFTCDQCGQLIQSPGIIQWDDYQSPKFTTLHKGPPGYCSHQWDMVHGRASWLGWRDLDVFIRQLDHNLKHQFDELEKGNQHD